MKSSFGIAIVWALTLLLGLNTAQASVVTGNPIWGGDRQGYVGEQVTLSLTEPELVGFDGAELIFSYDTSVLQFVDAGSNAHVTPLLQALTGGPGRATESLWLLADNTTTGSLELFTLIFKIIAFPTIGDTTDIEFTNSAMLPFGTGVYDRPSLAGTITVLTPGTVPIVGSDVLALTALLLLVLSRRSGRKPMAASRVALR